MSSPLNRLFYGDNLEILQEHVADESVDLVYLDPPFKSNQDYNIYDERSGAQVKAFEDTWHWDQAAAEAFRGEVVEAGGQLSETMQAFQRIVGHGDMLAYGYHERGSNRRSGKTSSRLPTLSFSYQRVRSGVSSQASYGRTPQKKMCGNDGLAASSMNTDTTLIVDASHLSLVSAGVRIQVYHGQIRTNYRQIADLLLFGERI